MGRAEKRRAMKEESKKSNVYTLTQAQIDQIKKQAIDEAVDKAFIMMLAIPCEVLANEGYWEKTAKKRLPKFIDEVLSLYDAYASGVVDMEEMEKDLWELVGIKLERGKR